MNQYHETQEVTFYSACEARLGICNNVWFVATSLLLCTFMLALIGGCSKSDDNKRIAHLLAEAKQASEKACEAANEAKKTRDITEQETQEAGKHLQRAKDSLHSAELEAAWNAAGKTISVAEYAEQISSTMAIPVETTFSEADKANNAVSKLRVIFKGKKDRSGMLQVSEKIGKEAERAVALAKSSGVEADNQERHAKAYREEAEAIRRLLSDLREAEDLLQQTNNTADQAETAAQIAQENGLRITAAVEQIRQARQRGDKSEALQLAKEVSQCAAAVVQAASDAQAYAETARKYANEVLQQTERISDELSADYDNSEVLAAVERMATDADRAAILAANAGQRAAHLPQLAKKQSKRFIVGGRESLDALISAPNQQDDFQDKRYVEGGFGGGNSAVVIPQLPPMPVMTNRPVGMLLPEPRRSAAATRPLRELTQACDSHESDFLPGGYIESEFHLRPDNVLEVRRMFGEKKHVTMIWRLSYQWSEDHSHLLIGKETKRRVSSAALTGFAIKDIDVEVSAATQPLPIKLPYQELPDGGVRLGNKLYVIRGQ